MRAKKKKIQHRYGLSIGLLFERVDAKRGFRGFTAFCCVYVVQTIREYKESLALLFSPSIVLCEKMRKIKKNKKKQVFMQEIKISNLYRKEKEVIETRKLASKLISK